MLSPVPFSTVTAETISRYCRSLKALKLSNISSVGDAELLLLVEGCPFLRCLTLSFLPNLSEESMRMLKSHRPRIASIGICDCDGMNLESVLSLLRESTIPTIFNSDNNEELRISALENLTHSIPYSDNYENLQISEFLASESLLERLVELLVHKKNRFVSYSLIRFLDDLVERGYHQFVVSVGVVPTLIQNCNSFNERELNLQFDFLESLSSHRHCQQHLLTSGVLSLFRPHLFQLLKVVESPSTLFSHRSSCLRNITVRGKPWSLFLRSSLNRWFRSKIGSAQFLISSQDTQIT
jgi:hypothetical protein